MAGQVEVSVILALRFTTQNTRAVLCWQLARKPAKFACTTRDSWHI